MRKTRRSVLACLLVALAVSMGYALALVPNIELMTITVFVAGFLLGAGMGMLVGAAAMSIYSFFNPLGAALPPLMAAQVTVFIVIGLAGAWCAPLVLKIPGKTTTMIISAFFGFMLALFYDTATSIAAYYVSVGPQASSKLWQFIAGGAAFMAMHQIWNAGLFFVVLPPVLNVLAGYRSEVMRS